MCIICLADCIVYFVYLVDLLYVYYMCNICSEYLYVMLFYVMLWSVAVRCLVLRISVPSLTVLFCSSDNKRLET